ncbi:hypothetical protein [Imhoffiella purpurea]|uniref:Glycosyltransferase RgtA/B/C/D-like domain-containing protein n=1 Tax=Imhoffiella purpurea TaxID=1249627 RepID=W9VJK9_9GAMM|nr:hypothetical protein [Imhoffiella purpurea]EXJ17191.1 hypothetical protein D779_0018 [Imhoffiella purpurea]
MGWWGVVLANGLPWLAGALWLRILWTESRPGVWPAILGYGYLLGFLAVAVVLRATAALGLPFDVVVPILMVGLAIAIGIGLRRLASVGKVSLSFSWKPIRLSWGAIPAGILLIWMLVRFLDLVLELWWLPLFPWDAWTTWLLRACVWAELGQWVPFISASQWLADPSAQAQTIAAWNYPTTVSLFGLWGTLGFGGWSEAAAKMPWIGCALALALGFYGQARLWGASGLTALVFLWLLVTLPLLDSHLALAGYADIWLATSVLLAFAALLHWIREGDWRQGSLAILCVLSCSVIKLEGIVWMLLFIPAVLGARLSGRWFPTILAAAGLAVGVVWMSGGLELNSPWGPVELGPQAIQLPLIGRFELAYHDNWAALWRNLFLYDNWHLYFYGLIPMLAWGLWRFLRSHIAPWERAGFMFVSSALFALYILFFWTGAYRWAEDATSVARLFMHFVPSFTFWALVLWSTAHARIDPEGPDRKEDASTPRTEPGDRVRPSPN